MNDVNAIAVESDKPRARIALVIEDDDASAQVLSKFLEAEGLSVIRALSAEDALVQVSRQVLALITLDLGLYGMNGWQFLQKLREKSTRGHAPVVIVSGRDVGVLAQTRGAAAVLLKPIKRSELKAILASLGLLEVRASPGR